MPTFPTTPLPASVSAPALIDPVLKHRVDAGYEVRRSRYLHGWRRYTLEWLGKTTAEMRTIRTFLEREIRGGALPFAWTHPSPDAVSADSGTPVVVTQTTGIHGLQTNQHVVIAGINVTINGVRRITRISDTQYSLQGTSGGGGGTGTAAPHLPVAVVSFGSEDTWESPQKLIGPERNAEGRFNFQLVIEERF